MKLIERAGKVVMHNCYLQIKYYFVDLLREADCIEKTGYRRHVSHCSCSFFIYIFLKKPNGYFSSWLLRQWKYVLRFVLKLLLLFFLREIQKNDQLDVFIHIWGWLDIGKDEKQKEERISRTRTRYMIYYFQYKSK